MNSFLVVYNRLSGDVAVRAFGDASEAMAARMDHRSTSDTLRAGFAAAH
jgi:hypothetical protein